MFLMTKTSIIQCSPNHLSSYFQLISLSFLVKICYNVFHSGMSQLVVHWTVFMTLVAQLGQSFPFYKLVLLSRWQRIHGFRACCNFLYIIEYTVMWHSSSSNSRRENRVRESAESFKKDTHSVQLFWHLKSRIVYCSWSCINIWVWILYEEVKEDDLLSWMWNLNNSSDLCCIEMSCSSSDTYYYNKNKWVITL